MAAAVLSPIEIAGLHHAPTDRDFDVSLAVYNTLPHPDDQPEVPQDMLKEVGEIFVRHKAHSTFGIHLLHGHFTAPEETVVLGTQVHMTNTTQACWTRPVLVTEIAAKPIHGHVFRLQSDGSFVPYEFHEGEAKLNSGNINAAFFRELAGFLHRNNLANLLALELLDGSQDHLEKELQVGPQATVVFHENDVPGFDAATITTGWYFKVGDDGIVSCKGGTVYSAKKYTHAVFVDGKPLPNVEALKKALRDEGIIG